MMEVFGFEIRTNEVSYISYWCSILGFGIAIITLILMGTIRHAVNRQRKALIFNFRAPDYLSSLTDECARFLEAHDKPELSAEIHGMLHNIKTTLEILRHSASGEIYHEICRAIRKINTYYKCDNYVCERRSKNEVGVKELMSIYTEVTGITTKIEEFIKTKGYGY
jgi:hypothetical protein